MPKVEEPKVVQKEELKQYSGGLPSLPSIGEKPKLGGFEEMNLEESEEERKKKE